MYDPREHYMTDADYHMSDEVMMALHGVPLPGPTPPPPIQYGAHRHPIKPPVPDNISYWADRMPSDQPNAGNDTFSIHTLQSVHQQYDLHRSQSDTTMKIVGSRIDCEMRSLDEPWTAYKDYSLNNF